MMRPLALCVLLLEAVSIPVQADPTVAIRWGSCPLPNTNSDYNRNYDGSTHQTITITATGLTRPIRGFDVRFHIQSPGSGIGDAWRFDAQGCNAGRAVFNQVYPNDTCPLLIGNNPQRYTRLDYAAELSPDGYISAFELFLSAAMFDTFTPDPTKTYTIARVDFDFAANCGCAERPFCAILNYATYLDADNLEIPFTTSREFLTWNDANNGQSCPYGPCELSPVPCPFEGDTLCVANAPTPAQLRSWGNLKASYR